MTWREAMSKYEVQENFLCGGWTNAWHTDDEPTIFDSYEDAKAELDWFLKDCKEAKKMGHMPDVPNRNDFRIVKINDDFYHVQSEHESSLIDNELEAWVRSL